MSGYPQTIMQTSATQKCVLGELRSDDRYGRKYRYCKNSSTALAAGKLTSCAAATANHINCSVAAAAIGALTVFVTVGATAVTADQYKDGFLQINDGTGEGHQYPIESNTACDASAVTTVQLAEPIRVALVASATTEASLIPSIWNGITVSATPESMCAGIPPLVIPASHYYWSQTGGQAICLSAGTDAVGTQMILSGTDGAMDPVATSSDIDVPKIGYAVATAGVSGEYKPIFLTID